MWKFTKWFLISLILLTLVIGASVIIVPKIFPQFGVSPSGDYLEQLSRSPNFSDGKFRNIMETSMNGENGSMLDAFWKFIRGGADREPWETINTLPFSRTHFDQHPEEMAFTWFGHSTVLLRIGGKNLLIDPVFSNHASPFTFLGPKAFPYSATYSLSDLPEIDAVLISHDHYDHLDYETILELRSRVNRFYVPLGVGGHLQHWGIPEEHIIEMDWWDETHLESSLLIACVPMRHFSGRHATDRWHTLWAGWVVKSGSHSVIHTGDSGYGDHFKMIGEKYGPFDFTMVECGQYNENWPYIHMMPEETVRAHKDLKGNYLLPIHWGRFNLSLHSWTDPVVRASNESMKKQANLITPVMGQVVTLAPPLPREKWWLTLK